MDGILCLFLERGHSRGAQGSFLPVSSSHYHHSWCWLGWDTCSVRDWTEVSNMLGKLLYSVLSLWPSLVSNVLHVSTLLLGQNWKIVVFASPFQKVHYYQEFMPGKKSLDSILAKLMWFYFWPSWMLHCFKKKKNTSPKFEFSSSPRDQIPGVQILCLLDIIQLSNCTCHMLEK